MTRYASGFYWVICDGKRTVAERDDEYRSQNHGDGGIWYLLGTDNPYFEPEPGDPVERVTTLTPAAQAVLDAAARYLVTWDALTGLGNVSQHELMRRMDVSTEAHRVLLAAIRRHQEEREK